jgi:signal transduction histidine kinase
MQKVELLGQLGAGVAHDLNNLLGVVSANAEWLRAREGRSQPEEEGAVLRDMHAAAGRAAMLTGRLLALGRGALAARAPLEVDALLLSLQPLLKALAGGSVDLVLRLDAGGARVAADALEIEQVVLNLVSNARAAIPDLGEIVITTTLVEPDQVPSLQVGSSLLPEERTAARWLRLTVRDNGSGMDAATLEHLFEAFFTTRAEASGTGLGLYSSAVLVRQTGGVIYARSTPGEGSAFTVDLPCLPGESS